MRSLGPGPRTLSCRAGAYVFESVSATDTSGAAPVWRRGRQPRRAPCPQTRRAQKIRGAWDSHKTPQPQPSGEETARGGHHRQGQGGQEPGVQRSEGRGAQTAAERALHGAAGQAQAGPGGGSHPPPVPVLPGRGGPESWPASVGLWPHYEGWCSCSSLGAGPACSSKVRVSHWSFL